MSDVGTLLLQEILDLPLVGSFVRPSVMRRASCMGSQKWQILPFIFALSHFTPQLSLSPLSFNPSHLTFKPPPLIFPFHFSPINSHFPLTFQPANLTFLSHFSPLPSDFSTLYPHFCLSLFTFDPSTVTFHPPSHFLLHFLSFSSKHLMIHKHLHTGKNLILCTNCNKQFPSQGWMEQHTVSHQGQVHQCQQCNTTQNLKIHI